MSRDKVVISSLDTKTDIGIRYKDSMSDVRQCPCYPRDKFLVIYKTGEREISHFMRLVVLVVRRRKPRSEPRGEITYRSD